MPVVFDNLIARGDMPPTIAVFINPGNDPSKGKTGSAKFSNRGYEYDSLGDRYVRFLLEEILPEVEKRYNVSKDPEQRAICGELRRHLLVHGGVGSGPTSSAKCSARSAVSRTSAAAMFIRRWCERPSQNRFASIWPTRAATSTTRSAAGLGRTN